MDMKRIFAFLLGICLLFSGCFSFSEPPRSTPFSLQSGQQDFSLGTFQITEKGIEGLVSVLRDYVPLPETLGLHMINAKVNSSGELQSFDLLLEGYDNSKNSTGLYWFSYWDHQMDYIPPEQYPSPELSVAYNSNNDLQALNREFLRIPWEQQFSLLQGSDFSISYNGNRQTLEGEPLIDGRNQVDFPILTWEEYQSGQGGVGDGKTSVLFTLKDHDSQSMIFLCDPDDPSTLVQSRQPGDQTACREKTGCSNSPEIMEKPGFPVIFPRKPWNKPWLFTKAASRRRAPIISPPKAPASWLSSMGPTQTFIYPGITAHPGRPFLSGNGTKR